MRNISPAGLQALLASESDSLILPAITIQHPSLPADIRLVADTQDQTLEGFVYLGCPFRLYLATDNEDTAPTARIAVDNVDRQLVSAIRSATTNPDCLLEVWRVPPTGTAVREAGPMRFTLMSVTVDAQKIEGTLGYKTDVLNEPATNDRFTPQLAPGLFA